ncbi:site-specific integrase [Dactylosporangium sp. NPDC050688]|uniref:site-specific integrase n=1 Tax=Dactylosporangium sp. NPDC050688 TaxID=3157217 RepID=UPI0033E2660F
MERERALGFGDRQPILVSPEGRVDAKLSEFFRRSRFSSRAAGTRESYVLDYRLFFSFLWRAGRNWDQAAVDDVEDWEDWRLRGRGNQRRIGGAKWVRELAALRLLYEWAAARGYVAASPVRLRSVRSRDGRPVQVAELAPTDVRSSNVKWLTPRAYRLWRDVGLRGHGADGRPDESWRGRNDGRDAAFADVLFASGLRRREAGTLLTVELPDTTEVRGYYAGRIAAAVAKHSERYFYVSAAALKGVELYRLTTRDSAVRRARGEGRYETLDVRWIVQSVSRRGDVAWVDEHGQRAEMSLNALTDRDRLNLFTDGEDGLEPLAVWLTEAGMPMRYRGWSKVFERASDRCRALGLEVFATPHMLRHSMALRMLVSLHHALDRRLGLTPSERRHYEALYGNVWSMVKDLLGHRSEETTRTIYLEPVRGLQLDGLLGDEEHPDNTELLARLAERTGLVLDVPGQVGA